MAGSSLVISRRQLASGVGQTTRENRVLPFAALAVQIPVRVGIFDPGAPAVVAVEPPPCLPGELRDTSVSGSWPVVWHATEPDIVSSDGVWRIDPTPWRRWSAYTNDGSAALGTLVHFNFSSPTTAAVADAGALPAHVQMIEGAWSSRTWYAKQVGRFPQAGLQACVQRLQSITLTQAGVTPPYTFTWTFSNDGEAATDATTPACINRNGHETGLGTRVNTFPSLANYSTYRRIKRMSLILAGFKTAIERKDPYGFLPTPKASDVSLYVGDSTSSADALAATDLSRLLSIGQPWHGLCTATAIERPGFGATTPVGYAAPISNNTRYFKALSPPGQPAAELLPPGFDAAGYAYLDDVVLMGGTEYSPKYVFLPGNKAINVSDNSWLHCDDAGVVRTLSASYAGTTGNSTKWNIYNLGALTGVGPTSVLLAQIQLVTTDAAAVAVYAAASGMRRFYAGSDDYQLSVSTVSGLVSPNVQLAKSHPIAASPNGRQIALFAGAIKTSGTTSRNIYTVATIDIASDLTVSAPTYVYQYATQVPDDAVTTHTWWSAAPAVIGSFWHIRAYLKKVTVSTPKLKVTCNAVCYDSAGVLHLFLSKWWDFQNYAAPLDSELSPSVLDYDTGVPATSPNPGGVHPMDGVVQAVYTYPDLYTQNFSFGGTWCDEFGMPSYAAYDPIVASVSSIYRLANNVVIGTYSNVGDTTTRRIATPSGYASISSVFPTTTANVKWCSWNPRTGQLVGRNDGAGIFSWI